MNKNKLNYVVEYIKTQPEFPFDVLDVEDGVETILAYFGFHPELDDDERGELKRELAEMAIGDELAEIAATVTLMEGHYFGQADEHIVPSVLVEKPGVGTRGCGNRIMGMPVAGV